MTPTNCCVSFRTCISKTSPTSAIERRLISAHMHGGCQACQRRSSSQRLRHVDCARSARHLLSLRRSLQAGTPTRRRMHRVAELLPLEAHYAKHFPQLYERRRSYMSQTCNARHFFVLFLMRFCYNVGVFDQKATSEVGAHRDREEILTGFIQTQR